MARFANPTAGTNKSNERKHFGEEVSELSSLACKDGVTERLILQGSVSLQMYVVLSCTLSSNIQ